MGQEPSFFHLFKRGRYSRQADNDEISRQNRVELFTVAAIGIVLKHDASFKRHFLKQICGVEAEVDVSEYRVICQSEHCSDLAILKETSVVYVIEAKVSAPLQDHQKPWKEDFETGGYGSQIRNEFTRFPEKHYIILQNDSCEEIQDSRPVGVGADKIQCHSKTWGDLFGDAIPQNALVEDLQDSLGEFDILALKSRKFKNMKNARYTSEAAAMYQQLLAVAKDIGITTGRIKWDVNWESDGAHFGVNIPKTLRDHQRFTSMFQNEPIGWLGFSKDEKDEPGVPDVWFYTHSQAEFNKVKSFVEKRCGPVAKVDKFCFSIRPSGDHYQSDTEWFNDVLKRLED